MWKTTVDGRKLNFHLSGINNQNFIMRDEETGSWWQQVTGECFLGTLKGHRLEQVFHDELTFGTWKRERPQGRVLRPDPEVLKAGRYAPPNWEERMAVVPVATNNRDQTLAPRTLIVGIALNNASKAYPLNVLQQQSPILDVVGGTPVLLLVGDDKRSVRAYERVIEGRKLEFFARTDAGPSLLIDAETGSEWDFTGLAKNGPLTGRQLKKILALNDYWFDWKTYHPETLVYTLGEREAR